VISSGDNLLPFGGELYYIENFISRSKSDDYFNQLFTEIRWKQEPIKMFGKEIMQPRLTAWYGDVEKSYTYSGITMTANHWIHPLLEIKSLADDISGEESTSVLMNLYRDGNDALGWHRDNEKMLGPTPVIASVSLGAVRTFQLRSYRHKTNLISFDLQPGSLVIMKGDSQKEWEHRVPRTSKTIGARINLTFRRIEQPTS
jgi:alkylated DNA repair dioxygenase AlkB